MNNFYISYQSEDAENNVNKTLLFGFNSPVKCIRVDLSFKKPSGYVAYPFELIDIYMTKTLNDN